MKKRKGGPHEAALSIFSRTELCRQRNPRAYASAIPDRGEGNAALSDDAVHLEDLGVLAVHVDAVRARDVPDVLGVRIPAVLL